MGALHKRESACGLGVPLFVGLRLGFLTVLVVNAVLRPASRMFEDRTYPNFRPASCVSNVRRPYLPRLPSCVLRPASCVSNVRSPRSEVRGLERFKHTGGLWRRQHFLDSKLAPQTRPRTSDVPEHTINSPKQNHLWHSSTRTDCEDAGRRTQDAGRRTQDENDYRRSIYISNF